MQRQEEGGTGGSHTLQTSECLVSFVVSKKYQISYQVPSLLSAKSTSQLNFSVSIVTTMKESFRSEKNQRSPATYFLLLNIHSSMTQGLKSFPQQSSLELRY